MTTTDHTQTNEDRKGPMTTPRPTLRRLALQQVRESGAAQTQNATTDPLPLGELKTVTVADIVVENRARKDLGDLKGLARSMADTGLAQPPLVDAAMRLVCGHRRVEAARLLGWTEMPVRMLDIEDPLALMVAEDANRKDLTSSEKYAICETLRGRAQHEGWRKQSFGG